MYANTGSPFLKAVTPSPIASTSPAMSNPSVAGMGKSSPPRNMPERIFQSTGFTPAERTRTSSSPAAGEGLGASSKTSFDASP
jgi:hypothetical protein